MLPASGRSKPATRFSSVLFPDPDGPVISTTSPGSSASDTSDSAWTRSPKRFETPSTTTSTPPGIAQMPCSSHCPPDLVSVVRPVNPSFDNVGVVSYRTTACVAGDRHRRDPRPENRLAVGVAQARCQQPDRVLARKLRLCRELGLAGRRHPCAERRSVTGGRRGRRAAPRLPHLLLGRGRRRGRLVVTAAAQQRRREHEQRERQPAGDGVVADACGPRHARSDGTRAAAS